MICFRMEEIHAVTLEIVAEEVYSPHLFRFSREIIMMQRYYKKYRQVIQLQLLRVVYNILSYIFKTNITHSHHESSNPLAKRRYIN